MKEVFEELLAAGKSRNYIQKLFEDWTRFGSLTPKQEATLTVIIAEYRAEKNKKPSDSELRQRAHAQENSLSDAEFFKQATPACDTCQDTGVFLCHCRGKEGVWAFRCDCPRGLSDPRTQIPHFKAQHSEEGFVFAPPSRAPRRAESPRT